jgi:hypothetical protein
LQSLRLVCEAVNESDEGTSKGLFAGEACPTSPTEYTLRRHAIFRFESMALGVP